jgi:hypothetical protein
VVVVGVGGVGVKDTTVAAARWAVPLASAPSRSDRLARVCEVNITNHSNSKFQANLFLNELQSRAECTRLVIRVQYIQSHVVNLTFGRTHCLQQPRALL